MQAVKETLSNAKLRPTKMIQPNCSNLLQTLTLGCMLGLTGYFGNYFLILHEMLITKGAFPRTTKSTELPSNRHSVICTQLRWQDFL